MLLPHLGGRCINRVECGTGSVTISARSRAVDAICRRCGACSARVHSSYVRRLSDGARGGRPVVISLTVRRFFCVNADCAVTTFAEQVDGLSARYRRRTVPALATLEQVGLAPAGRAGAAEHAQRTGPPGLDRTVPEGHEGLYVPGGIHRSSGLSCP